MKDNDRIGTFIHSFSRENSPIIETIRQEALDQYVPIIRKEMESFLRVYIELIQPDRILEVGTAVGYSALLMSECMPQGCTITTIENYEKRIPIARRNFEAAGKADVITLLEGDAAKILPTLEGTYGLIFMDAAKGQYLHFFPEIHRLLESGGVLICDNIFQEGDLLESRYGIDRRNRTIHSRLREYLQVLKEQEDLETSIVPIGDGVTVSVKKRN